MLSQGSKWPHCEFISLSQVHNKVNGALTSIQSPLESKALPSVGVSFEDARKGEPDTSRELHQRQY